ncbi:MAG: hypothetical protein KBC62_04315 [Candidatus Pacebacteria bacterium]|nr:hypothetical protein [Candidatus Paceibacterota bacterium]
MIYEYTGGATLLGAGVALTNATVEAFEEVDGGYRARGSLSYFDSYEGCKGNNRWEAELNREGNWTIVPTKDDIFWLDEENNPMFTLASDVNKSIAEFFSERLTAIKSLMDGGATVEALTEKKLVQSLVKHST